VLHEQTRWWTWQTPVVAQLIVQAACSLADWLKLSTRLADGPIGPRFDSLTRVPAVAGISVAAVCVCLLALRAAFAGHAAED
jgi:hypothetical protein